MGNLTTPPLGLYVHLPWCVRKCPYCDFNSHAARGDVPFGDYTEALLRDADDEARAADGRVVETIFIGGGTPSLFPPDRIRALLEGLHTRLALADDCEITLEANPGTMELKRFRAFREAGITRLSIGVQSFNDSHLRRLGRIHSADQAMRAVGAAADAGFDRCNVDLMFALPEQTEAQAVADVDRGLDLGAHHLSHYQLTLEPGTAFHFRPPALPDEDRAAAMQAACAQRLRGAGLERYEVSAWAMPGHECRHNLNYWRFGDYLAIGAGGHGKITVPNGDRIRRYSKVRLPKGFMERAGTPAAVVKQHDVSSDDRALEFMMNALRLTAGVPARYATERTGLAWEAFAQGMARGHADGLIAPDPDRIRPTARGIEFLNDALGHFL